MEQLPKLDNKTAMSTSSHVDEVIIEMTRLPSHDRQNSENNFKEAQTENNRSSIIDADVLGMKIIRLLKHSYYSKLL